MELIDGALLNEEIRDGGGSGLLCIDQWREDLVRAACWRKPLCPFCQSRMILRGSRSGSFWGCSTYPRCRGKRDARKGVAAEPA